MPSKKLIAAILSAIMVIGGFAIWRSFNDHPAPSPNAAASSSAPSTISSIVNGAPGFKTYRNSQWGFQFQFPEDWTFDVDGVSSSSSKFNLVGNASAAGFDPNDPGFSVSVVSPEFAPQPGPLDRVSVFAAGVNGSEYFWSIGPDKTVDHIGYILPLGQDRLILNAARPFDVFRKIIGSLYLDAEPTHPPVRTYQNAEFGFEFQYPANWTFEINSFKSSSSKFNLQGDATGEHYNFTNPDLLINIVTPDFAAHQHSDMPTSTIDVGGVAGIKYWFTFEGVKDVGVILPLGQYKMLLGAPQNDQGAAVFNQILSTFKFLK